MEAAPASILYRGKLRTPQWIETRRLAIGIMTPEQRERKELAKKPPRPRPKLPPKPKPHHREHAMVKRDGIWRVMVPDEDGKRHQVSTGTADLREALKVVDASGIQRLSLLARAKCVTRDATDVIMRAHSVSCDEVRKAWAADLTLDQARKTVKTYDAMISSLFNRLGCRSRPLSSVTREQLHAFINDPKAKLCTKTVRLSALRSFYQHASGYGHVIGNIASTLKINLSYVTLENRHREPARPFTEAQMQLVVTHPDTPDHWRQATILGYWLGLRMVDVCTLEKASLGEEFVELYPKKTGRRLILPIHDPLIGGGALREVVREILADHSSKIWCFPYLRVQYLKNSHACCSSYRRVLDNIGLKDHSFHGLRHSFRLRLSQSGKPIEEVSRLMGHGDIETTLAYGRGYLTEHSGDPVESPVSA